MMEIATGNVAARSSEVGHPLLVRRLRLELAIQHVVSDGTALSVVLGQAAPSGPGTQGLRPHQTLDTVQSAALAQGHHIVPNPASTVGPVAAHKALPHLGCQRLVFQAAPAARPHQPRIEAASRDTERLAHKIHRPGHPVLRDELELHSESLAK